MCLWLGERGNITELVPGKKGYMTEIKSNQMEDFLIF